MANKLKQILQNGKPAIGTWLGCCDPYFVEMMADLGFDWLLIDMEHIPLSQEGLRTMLMACKGSESTILVRVSLNSRNYIQAALDLGAQGIMVPMVNSRADAERAVEFARYPPLGRRGLGPVRAGRYGKNDAAYRKTANEETSALRANRNPGSGAQRRGNSQRKRHRWSLSSATGTWPIS